MAFKIDYEALRAQTVGIGNDEAVTVNTRALIDKVLARYSGEWTTLRELLQNAADASAKQVTIRFETLPSPTVPVPQSSDPAARLKHVLLHHSLKSMVVENDGEVFKPNDWARLKKIAEGNPDETKIGAFGVGFYSVFADCEEPFVSSGQEALAFYWKGDALFTKRLQLPDSQNINTTFILPMRHLTSPIPNLLSLCRFLTSSLTFVGLEAIELWLDEWRVMILDKKTAPSLDVNIPKEINRKTREGLMQITSIVKEPSQLGAKWCKVVEWNPALASQNAVDGGSGASAKGGPSTQSLRSIFSRLNLGSSKSAAMEKLANEERETQHKISEDLLGESSATLFVHVTKATVRTNAAQNFSSELERATKKPPPKTTTVSLLSTSYDERMASTSATFATVLEGPKVFDSFVPANGKGRIFIGFTTNQTTGLNVHISTPSVIPTVERESIDLNNRFVRVWNVELLRVAGVVARISWSNEMIELKEKLSRALRNAGRRKIVKEDIDTLLPEALFLHNTYSWTESTPSFEVSTLMEEAFWSSNQKSAIATLSTHGVLPASQVRLEPEGVKFVEGIPTLPQPLASVGLVKKLIDYGVITEITITDIKSELEGKALNASQLRKFLEWIGHKARIEEMDGTMIRSLLNVVVANDDETLGGGVLVLAEMKTFLNSSRISPEMPVPRSTLPFKFTKNMNKEVLELLGFEDLHTIPWLRWLIENIGGRGDLAPEQDISRSPTFAASVLPVISKQWDGLSSSSKNTVVDLLTSRTVVPTKLGMKKPAEAYFPNVKLFDDIPIVIGVNGVKDKFLAALGVRKTIEIGVVFDRLMDSSPTPTSKIPKSSGKWSHVDLIKYLVSVQADIPFADIARLKESRICPAETESLQPTEERYLLSELCHPDQALRNLKLRTMHWAGVLRPDSPEGRFLTFLGLRSCPSYVDLIQIMSSAATNENLALRERAMKYFIDHHTTKGYAQYDHSNITIPYLPIQGSDKRIASPNNVFANEQAAIMGFNVLRRDLQIHALKFGVKQDPPVAECINRLVKNPPQSKRSAREIFSYFTTRLTDINSERRDMLSGALIVPVPSKSNENEAVDEKSERITHAPPRICFLGDGEKYADIFDYVDFGHTANQFLLGVGSKHEPSTIEVARLLIREPARIFSVLGDQRYAELLRNIAGSWSTLRKDKQFIKDMRASKCLLAYREISSKSSSQDDQDEKPAVKSWELASPGQIVIADDIIIFNLFRSKLLAAPDEDILEDLYHSLGSSQISTLVEERQTIGNLARDQQPAAKLQLLLCERTRLFLHGYDATSVKHDGRWIEKNISAACVQSITLHRSLRGYNLRHTQSRSAVVHNEKPTLYISSKGYDMYEVSQALVPVLLHRSKPESVFVFEIMLDSPLRKLQSRGYNVDRILRQKATEARIVEETRKQQLAQEQREIKEREATWKQSEAERAGKVQEQDAMPGIFPDSPDHKGSGSRDQGSMIEERQLEQSSRGFFSGIGKHFGFDNTGRLPTTTLPDRGSRGIQASPEDPPPPYSNIDAQKSSSRPPQPEVVTAPHRLQQNLVNAVQASRPHNSSSVVSQPAVNEVKETNSYCDAKPAQDISYIGEISNVRTFLSNVVAAKGLSAADFLAANASALKLFAAILLDCADNFALKRDTIHIFYDDTGSTIAFNQSKALFFNYRYFESLHLPQAQQGNKSDAIVYWCVVMAHELAHNLVSEHSSQHSYYTEALIIQYFSKIASKIAAPYSSSGDTGARVLPPDPLHPGRQEGRSLLD